MKKFTLLVLLCFLFAGCASTSLTIQEVGITPSGLVLVDKVVTHSHPKLFSPSSSVNLVYTCLGGPLEDGSKDICAKAAGKILSQKGVGNAVIEKAIDGAAFVAGMGALRPSTFNSTETTNLDNNQGQGQGSYMHQGQGQLQGQLQGQKQGQKQKAKGGHGYGGEGGHGGKGGKGGNGYGGKGGHGYGGDGGNVRITRPMPMNNGRD